MNGKLDKRRRHYLILDCETTTLASASKFDPSDKKKISIAKPLIYDIGWTVCDRAGYVYRRRSFLVSEIFGNPELFQAAHYANKRPMYLREITNNERLVRTWYEITAILESDMNDVDAVGAYNAMFDFKKAIPFTESYISHVYSDSNFAMWLATQERICEDIINGKRYSGGKKSSDSNTFQFRRKTYPLFDIWGLACAHVLNCDRYKEKCLANGWKTATGKYYATSAEKAFAFISGDLNFVESHTALKDAEIETEIFRVICQRSRNKFEMGISHFPFKILGIIEE